MNLKTTLSRRLLQLLAAIGLIAATVLPSTSAAAGESRSAQLDRALAQLDGAAIAGTGYGVIGNQIVVDYDDSVTSVTLARLHALTARFGNAVKTQHVQGVLAPFIAGGDAIYGGPYRCSLGFNVKSGNTFYFLTAGHCGKAASPWYTNSAHTTLIGPVTGASFPGKDYAIVRYDNASLSHPGTACNTTITSAPAAFIAESVKRCGSTTGTHTGVVQALNQTVHYSGGGTVRGLIKTNVCAEPGDSGGPLIDGSKAIGITSGGSGNCSSGGTTYFQPVPAALAAYGVSLV